jgi:hypothetical protein
MDHAKRISDTSPEALAAHIECLRRLTPQQRFRKACELTAQVRRMAFAAIRRRHGELAEDDLQNRFIELVYGKQLAEQVAKWKTGQRD